MKRVLWAGLAVAVLLGTGGSVGAPAAIAAQLEPGPPERATAPRVVDLGDGTVVLVRDPNDIADLRAPARRVPETLPAYVPDAAVQELPGDAFSTYPADFHPIPLHRLLSAGPSALYDQQVIGVDNRVRVRNTTRYPAAATAQVYIVDSRSGRASDEDMLCTGGIVGAANLLVTAAHCVFDTEYGRWYDDWLFYPGMRDADTTPFGACGWRKIYVHRKWITTGRSEYDTAAVILDCKVGDRTGWYGARQSTGNGFIAGTHHIYQYPGDKPFGTQWYDSGPWSQVGTFAARVPERVIPAARAVNAAVYTIDTAPGSSGAPVIHDEGSSYYLTAVHTQGSPQANYGVLLWKQTWKKVIYKAYKKAIK